MVRQSPNDVRPSPDPEAVARTCKKRVAERNDSLNALVTMRAWEEVLVEVKEAEDLPLHGLLFTAKDTFDLAGVRSTAGSTRLAARVPQADAVAISRLRARGGVPFAKSNVPSMAGDLVTENQLFGRTVHPEDPQRTPGGSSGGGAAAVASGLTPLDLCSDLGGSARVPAHYCGTFGHKLTFGLCPLTGHVPPPPGCNAPRDLACIGVLASDAPLLAAAVQALATPAGNERHPSTLALHEPVAEPPWRVAVWLSDPYLPTPPAHVDAIDTALRHFEQQTGSLVEDLDRPAGVGLEPLDDLFRTLLVSDTSRFLSNEQFQAGHSSAPSLAEDDRSTFAQDVRASIIVHRDWLAADERRHAIRSQLLPVFDDYDALVCPVSPVLAPFHPAEADRYRRVAYDGSNTAAYFTQMTWSALASITYLPATVAPVGRVRGLPLGLQVIGPPLGDLTTITIADALASEHLTPWTPDAQRS